MQTPPPTPPDRPLAGMSALPMLASERALTPQEERVALEVVQGGMSIVIPREIRLEESRLSLTPDAVRILCGRGHQVTLQAGAGTMAKFPDHEYAEAGAQIALNAQEAYAAGDTILKVNPPTEAEIELIRPGSVVVSALQHSQLTSDFIQAMNRRRLTGIAYEMLEDEVGGVPIVRAMSEIAGSTVLLIAAEYLSSSSGGRGMILGGITGVPPTKIVIIGAGSVGEFCARMALGLGAEVKIFDNQLYKLRRIKQEIGQQLFTSTIDVSHLTDALQRADVVVGALRAEDGRSPCVVTEEMVAGMKPESVIIDVSIDQGGCFETSEITTHSHPVYKKHGVIHYCVPNIPARVAHTATMALSNIITPILLSAHRNGGIDAMIFKKDWLLKGVYCYRGALTNLHLARRLGLRHKDLTLLKVMGG